MAHWPASRDGLVRAQLRGDHRSSPAGDLGSLRDGVALPHEGRHRWVFGGTLGWLLSYKRLALRYDRSAATITALARLATTLICARRLPTN